MRTNGSAIAERGYMADVLDIADQLWRGELDTTQYHPFGHVDDLAESTTAGLRGVVRQRERLRHRRRAGGRRQRQPASSPARRTTASAAWTDGPVHTAVFTHGHIDHCFGVERYDADNAHRAAPPCTVVAHEAVPARFDRYRATAATTRSSTGASSRLGDQFEWPTEYRYPDRDLPERLDLDVGGERFELHHARGETDDHTWVWVPSRRVLVHRRPLHLGVAQLREPPEGAALPEGLGRRRCARWPRSTPRCCSPATACPIVGADRVREALTRTRRALLEHLHDATLEMMNDGATLDDIVHTVAGAGRSCSQRPYLRPVYDEPEFVVRNMWRLYGGWYDGNPRPPQAGTGRRGRRARSRARRRRRALAAPGASQLADGGDLRLAGSPRGAGPVAAPRPTTRTCTGARAEVYERRVADATSTMAKGRLRLGAPASHAPSPTAEVRLTPRSAGTVPAACSSSGRQRSRGPDRRTTSSGGIRSRAAHRGLAILDRGASGIGGLVGAPARGRGCDGGDRGPAARLEEARALRRARSVEARAVDLGDLDAAVRVVDDAWEAFGGLDCLVNNAAIPKRVPVSRLTDELVDETMRINFTSPVRMTSALLPRWLERGSGCVVNVSSMGDGSASPTRRRTAPRSSRSAGGASAMAHRPARHRRRGEAGPPGCDRDRDLGPPGQRPGALQRAVRVRRGVRGEHRRRDRGRRVRVLRLHPSCPVGWAAARRGGRQDEGRRRLHRPHGPDGRRLSR